MYKIKFVKTSIITLLLASSLSSCTSFKSSFFNNSNDSKIVGEYKYGKITENEAQTELDKIIANTPKLKGLKFADLPQDQQQAIIKEYAVNQVLYRKAKKQNLDDDSDYSKALKIFKTEILKQKLLTKIAKDATSKEKLKQKYDELVKNLENKQDYKVSYIVLEDKNSADNIYKRIAKKPSSFGYYAKTKSIDKETAKNKGDLGFVLEDSLPSDVVKIIKSLKKNDISKPIKLDDKWVIVKYTQTRPAEIVPYSDAKENLRKILGRKVQKEYVEEIIEQANIKFVD